MTDVQRFRQSGYDNSLVPSTNEGDAHYMFYKDHAVVVSLLREQITKAEQQLEAANLVNTRLFDALRQSLKVE